MAKPAGPVKIERGKCARCERTTEVSNVSRLLFVVSAVALIFGSVMSSALLCIIAWLLLWAAAVVQDWTNSR